MGQESVPYNRTKSTKLPYMRILVRVEMCLLRQSVTARPWALLHLLLQVASCSQR
jgi:hypothetical protein